MNRIFRVTIIAIIIGSVLSLTKVMVLYFNKDTLPSSLQPLKSLTSIEDTNQGNV